MKKQTNLAPYIALFFAMMFWGLSFVWTKQLLEVFTPTIIIFFRLVLSFLLLLLIASISRRLQKIQRKDYIFFVLLSITQPFLYFIFEGYGIKYTSASIASIIIATIPLFTPVGAYFYLGERLTRMNLVGLAISFVGVILVVAEFGATPDFSLYGLFMLFMAVITGTVYGLGLKRLTATYNSITITTYQNLIGIILFIPLVLIFERAQLFNAPALFTLELLRSLFYLALFASSFAFVLFAYGIQKIGPSKASAFSNSIPVFTLMFAYFALGESISPIKTVGIAVVLLGLYLSQKNNAKQNARE